MFPLPSPVRRCTWTRVGTDIDSWNLFTSSPYLKVQHRTHKSPPMETYRNPVPISPKIRFKLNSHTHVRISPLLKSRKRTRPRMRSFVIKNFRKVQLSPNWSGTAVSGQLHVLAALSSHIGPTAGSNVQTLPLLGNEPGCPAGYASSNRNGCS
jgi:hypothetical protein